MPSVLDSLFIEIGLDPKNFTEGQKNVLDSFKKTQEEANKRGKQIEEEGRRINNFMGRLRAEAITLFATLAGAGGIKDFVASITTSDAALGRLSRNLGVSAETLSKWQGVARISGGTAEGMATTFQTLSDTFAGWQIGRVSPMVADLRAISAAGGTIIDVNKGVEQSFIDLAANLQAIHAKDPARAGLLGRMLGLDPAFFDVLIRGPDAVRKMLAMVKDIGTATKDDTERAGELAAAWNRASLSVEAAGRVLLNLVSPKLIGRLDDITNYFKGFAKYWSGKDWFPAAPSSSPLGSVLPAGGAAAVRLGNTGLGAAAVAHTQGGTAEGTVFITKEGQRRNVIFNGGDTTNLTGVGAAASSNVVNSRSSNSSSDVKVGPVNVYTQATDAEGIARDLTSSVRVRQGFSALANDGQQ